MRQTRVFVSSRFEEFKELRGALRSLFEDDHDVDLVMLDDGEAARTTARQRSTDELKKSDFVVFLLGKSYSNDQGENTSITEEEFDLAVQMNSEGAALEMRVWSYPADDSKLWEPQAQRFLNKAMNHKVVGVIEGTQVFRDATRIAANLRMAITERRDEEDLDAGATFLESTEQLLKSLFIPLHSSETKADREKNEHRNKYLSIRDNAVSAIAKSLDLSWVEKQLLTVREGVLDDLLTNVLLIHLYHHRDRPTDRRKAADLSQILLKSEQSPRIELSLEWEARRRAELIALRARSERLAVSVGYTPRLDEIRELLEQAKKDLGISRSVLGERVMWANMIRLHDTVSDELAENDLTESLKDLMFVYPDYAIDLAESHQLPLSVTERVARIILHPTSGHVHIAEQENTLRAHIRVLRSTSETMSSKISQDFLEMTRLQDKLNGSESRHKSELEPLVNHAREMLFDKQRVNLSDFETTSSLDALVERVRQFDDQVENASEEFDLGNQTPSVRPNTATPDQLRHEISRMDLAIDQIHTMVSTTEKQTSWLSINGRRRWLKLAVRALIGFGIVLIISRIAPVHDYLTTHVESIWNDQSRENFQKFFDKATVFFELVLSIGTGVVAAAYAFEEGSVVISLIAFIIGFVGGAFVGIILLYLILFALVLAMITVLSLGVGTVFALPVTWSLKRKLRKKTSQKRDASKSMQEKRAKLAYIHDAKVITDLAEKKIRMAVRAREDEINPIITQVDGLMSELRVQVSTFNSCFSTHPAIYNRNYVPFERASTGDLTRESWSGTIERNTLVLGRRISWQDCQFFPIPMARQDLQTTEQQGLQSLALELALSVHQSG